MDAQDQVIFFRFEVGYQMVWTGRRDPHRLVESAFIGSKRGMVRVWLYGVAAFGGSSKKEAQG